VVILSAMSGEGREASSPEEATVEDRLVQLETRSEFQAKTVDDLDDVVREFTERVERLERELAELRAVLVRAAEAGADEQPDSYIP
jgi:uncharacterized coiled-coil protein SlyX